MKRIIIKSFDIHVNRDELSTIAAALEEFIELCDRSNTASLEVNRKIAGRLLAQIKEVHEA